MSNTNQQRIVQCSCGAHLGVPRGAGSIRCSNCNQVLKLPASAAQVTPAPAPQPQSQQTMVVACPGCSSHLRLNANMGGQKLRCASCSTVFQAPSASQAAVVQPAYQAQTAPTAAPSVFDSAPSHSYSPASSPLPASGVFDSAPAPYSQPSTRRAPVQRARPRSQFGSNEVPEPAQFWKAVGISAGVSFIVGLLLTLVATPVMFGILLFSSFSLFGMVSFAGFIWLVVIGFEESVEQGLLCLLVPCYVMYYHITRWSVCWKPTYLLWIPSTVMLGYMIGGFLGTLLFVGALMNA